MQSMTVSDFRKNLAAALDSVVDNYEEVVIARPGGEAVVVVPLGEWESMKETLHVLGTPQRARELLDSMAELDAGLGEGHELIDPESKPAVSNRLAA